MTGLHRGDRVGARFELVGQVAKGGMGTVFRARDLRGKRDVAVKIVDGTGPDELARFAREVQILATVAHPGIVGYVAHGDTYLVMEWVDGETLAQRLAGRGVTAREAVGIARELADALAALHAAGIVHRDVKPANVMLAADRVKLVDFGIARSAAAARLTRTGMHVGTAGYMAPEQARGDREITSSADVFALGCVLHECLAGAPAFTGDSALALRAKVLLHDPPRLTDVPAALATLVAQLLARDPLERPGAAAAAAALAALDPAALTGSVPARPPRDATTTVSERPACAVLVALDDPEVLAALGSARPFDGGAVAVVADAHAAARLALALATRLPAAAIAVACGRSADDAIDRTARLVEDIAIAAETGVQPAGAWVDEAVVRALGTAFAIERVAGRARLQEAT